MEAEGQMVVARGLGGAENEELLLDGNVVSVAELLETCPTIQCIQLAIWDFELNTSLKGSILC